MQREAEKGKSVPAIDNQPELYEDLNDVWNAFAELNETRSIGFGPGPITFSEIEAWLRLYDIVREKQDYVYLIHAMDRVWLKWQGEQHGKTDPHR